MIAYLLRRSLQSLGVLACMSLLVFAAVYAIGNPVELLVNPNADESEIERSTQALGLDRSLAEQYGVFLRRLAHGELGDSFVHNAPALTLILERLPATLELALCAMVIALGVGIPLGLWAGYRPRSIAARLIDGFALLGLSLPTFWVGLLLLMLFCVQLGWLPASGRGGTVSIAGIELSLFTLDGLRHLLLPACTLALFKLSLILRLTRTATREAWCQDYVKTARAKGLADSSVLRRHVLPNVLLPVITVSGIEFGSLVAFSVVTESIYAWPGAGKLLIDAIGLLDRPVIVAYVLLTALMFVLINWTVDFLYAIFDPRVRAETQA